MNDNLTKNVSNEAESPAFLVGAVMRSCPFCGGEDLFIHETPSSDRTVTWYKLLHTATRDCGVSMLDSNKEDLIVRWNKRA